MTLPPGLDEDALSRILNAYFGGDPGELFSARCHRLRWRSLKWAILRLIVDDHFWRVRGERGHCRAAYFRERVERAELPDRARLAGI